MAERKITFADRVWVKNLGLAVALISFIGSVYMWFFYQNSPNYEYDIISQSAILVDHAELPTIKIYVDSVDIHHSEENISIIEIRVSNTGKASLRRDDYDTSDFGLILSNAQLLCVPELSLASTDYIRGCFGRHDFNDSGSFISMPTLPLDSKDFYQFKIVVLHKDNELVNIKPIGKIIGQRDIVINAEVTSGQSFLIRVFDENIWIHLLRMLFYFIILFGLLVFIIALGEKVDEKKKTSELKSVLGSQDVSLELVSSYNKYGLRLFEDMMTIYKIPEKELFKKYMSSLNFTKYERNKVNIEHWEFHKLRISVFRYMLKNSYLTMNKSQINYNLKKKKSVEDFYARLSKMGVVSYQHIDNDIEYIDSHKSYLEI